MIIIPQTKGGVGKSTVAMQVIAPYLYKKHGKKITYIEIDDENNDSRSFTRTEIVNKRMLGTNRLSELDELILMDDNHEVIVDVGGNKTSSLVLEEIKKVGSFGNIKWIIPLGDGELALKTATTARSYRTNTKLNTILDDLISDLALPKGQIIRYSDNVVLPFSKSFTGTASENLRNLASSTGRTFSVQDSSVYFTVKGKALPQNIFILNESSGLIGIPTPRTMSAKQEYILQQKKDKAKKEELKKKYQNKEDVGLTVSCLLNGAVLPETTVYLDSIYLKGFYKAVEVIHTGSYEGDGEGSWTTEMKLAEVQGKLE